MEKSGGYWGCVTPVTAATKPLDRMAYARHAQMAFASKWMYGNTAGMRRVRRNAAESASQAVKRDTLSRSLLPSRRTASAVAADATSTAAPRPGASRPVARPTAYCESPSNATCARDAAANADPDGFGDAPQPAEGQHAEEQG